MSRNADSIALGLSGYPCARIENRAGGPESLHAAVDSLLTENSLPVVIIGNPQQVMNDRDYAVRCAATLLEIVEKVEDVRGAGRLYIP